MNSNYFMNMYSVAPVLSAPGVVPLSTINHSDAMTLAIPNVSGNNNAVRTICTTSTAPMPPHPGPNSGMVPHPQTSHLNSHKSMSNYASPSSRPPPSQPPPPAHPQPAQSHKASASSANQHHNDSCDTPFVCGICNQGFRKPAGLKKHMKVHSNTTGGQLAVANNRTPYSHDDNSTPSPYKCNVCKIVYPNAMSFEHHINTEHSQPQALKCTQCGCFRPITLTALKPFRCESCSDGACGSLERTGMLRYQITKSTTAPIAAQQIHVSPGSTTLKGNIKLEVAALLQQGTFSEFWKKPHKPHKCPDCEKSYKHGSTLAMHKKTHTGECKYRCEYCNKGFFLTEYYNRHMRVHTKEKPYRCDVCDKSFSQSNTLTQHKRIHTG